MDEPKDDVKVGKPVVKFDDFAKLDLRVARVLECFEHPNADKLLVLKIDLGIEQRQICAGLKSYYKPEQLVGKLIVVVANLEPRTMRGQVSQGMLLAASEGAMKERVIFIEPSEEVVPGSVVA
jgi:methionine--tRNA ligase beta chain